jgi:hypothetical protein
LAAIKLRQQTRKALVFAFGPPVLDQDVFTFGVSKVAQALPECFYEISFQGCSRIAEIADACKLVACLGARQTRPGNRRDDH